MQLNRLVNFHKALGDKTRLRIIALLKDGPLHGQAIAGKLGLTAPTISHHIAKLREISVIYERREKNTIYFYLDEKKLTSMAEAVLTLGSETAMDMPAIEDAEKAVVLKNFLDHDGRIKELPAKRKKKLIVLEYLVEKLEIGKIYPENELNTFIKQYHEDYATIRREFVMCQFMYRQNGQYELNPKEMWPL
ncbi:metalloregulator ArsR/SmtB family transcription factor [Salipaludibacillus agaradhaerens]|uniref:Metalloregulator ArsR/SmtB family transcription factor n=1 Tax=Salipaludibacillus agaradhaerens TaxID=76935 RepID=A0A9Q4FZM7_SALAG|nr:metalloregulator ArsR/SmtB family transcription factor [Salipaludibacillus agaradhaerens]MCR6097591.1 metalloregulator ArsR/SmtB family transcription factor [Salipaludibacillus agaradhaerens]MCR6112925.1 metalloregulator ArsR/SmtB family transcription factor [Salipaludibacillus agaradhaerens]